ncbi:biotin transporter BioY [Georgenia sp. SYP-B2076]|uniref:biotin transporter BioY n=1 Tax=Georgenia sp. SYP-B2076 TaxID=2495881 RepID=UPI000F8C7765|nr:biotin transporter BioY [Georgenia sp. SYP-B2076]
MSVPAAAPGVLLDALPVSRLRDASAVVGGAAAIALIGQAVVPLPFTPVPLTLGTLGVLLFGAALGPVRAAASVALLLLVGVAGLPVFADGTSGWAFASFGYVLGYLPAAVLMGRLARRGGDRSPWRTIAAAAAASTTVYALGVPWLMAYLHVGLVPALTMGVVPFVAGDAVKAVVAALCLPGTWRLLRMSRARRGYGREAA